MYADAIEHALGQLLATVHGDLPGAVFERRIAEAGDETVGIGQQINAGNGQRRSLFVKHQLAGGAAEDVIPHAVANVRMPCQIAKPGEERVAAVEHPQLHLLPGQHVIGHLHARRLPGGSPGDKVIFDHPLNEGFATDGAGIVDPQHGGDFRQRLRCGRGNNAIHHGAREADVVGDPVRQRRAAFFRHAEDGIFYHVTVVGDIIAGEHGKGRKASFPAAGQRFN